MGEAGNPPCSRMGLGIPKEIPPAHEWRARIACPSPPSSGERLGEGVFRLVNNLHFEHVYNWEKRPRPNPLPSEWERGQEIETLRSKSGGCLQTKTTPLTRSVRPGELCGFYVNLQSVEGRLVCERGCF